jgi:hypothetical protein
MHLPAAPAMRSSGASKAFNSGTKARNNIDLLSAWLREPFILNGRTAVLPQDGVDRKALGIGTVDPTLRPPR